MAQFAEVLKNKNFFFLWLGQIISQFGDRLNQMALIALIYTHAPGSTFALAKVLSFTIIPVFIIGPIAGVYVDRWNRKYLMIACDILRGLLVLLFPLLLIDIKIMPLLYFVIFLVFSITRFFLPAKLSIIPDLVSQDKLLMANSLTTTTGMIAAVIGFALGGIIVEAVGVKGGFYIDALTYFVSALCIFFVSSARTADATSGKPNVNLGMVSHDIQEIIRKSVFSDLKEGFQFFIGHKAVSFVRNILFIFSAGIGAIYVVSIVFVQQQLHTTTKYLGLLAMFVGAGLFLGTLVYGRVGHKLAKDKVIFIGLIFSGIFLNLFALYVKLYPSFIAASLISLFLGISVAPILISANTLIYQISPNNMRGRTFSSLEVVIHFAFLIFMFLGAAWAECIGRTWVMVITSLIFIICGFIGMLNRNKGKVLINLE